MNDSGISIGAEGVDTAALVEQIRATVEQKRRDGVYTDPVVARAEQHNLAHLKDQDGFFRLYLESLREAVFVDINDFEIHERRRFFAPALVRFKRTLWSLLKFYTYRLWSQQNQINGLLLSLAEEQDDKYRRKIEQLEKRMAELEARLKPPS